jgi:site-specific DNA-methyltransferase (adenine-specific)
MKYSFRDINGVVQTVDYENVGNKAFNVDCMVALKETPDKFYDLCICDPPYGIGADKKNSTNKKQSRKSATNSTDYGNQRWDDGIPTEEYFKELFRVSKNQIIWGVNYYPYDFLTGGRIYWDKRVTMPTYSNGELAYCSLINSIKSVEITWHGMLQENMNDKEIRIHPTQKPVALYEWLLKNYAKPGDKILDTHVGSASSLIACHKMGFDYLGFEIDEEYYNKAKKRLDEARAQQTIFGLEGLK